jgi:1,4-dihydroxy-2-naphthoate octaprenyltransferase
MNVAMWGTAIRTIPRVTKDEWEGLDIVSRWLIAARAGVLVITFIPCCIVALLAASEGDFDPGVWVLMTAGLLLAHATNNLLNDMTDYARGVDRDNYFRAQYGVHPLEHGLLTTRQMAVYATLTGAAALAFGGWLAYLRGPEVLILLAAGAFFVLFYTFPLKYIGLGELAVLIVWGPLMIGGGYYVVTQGWDWNVVVAGMPYALGATTVIFGKHIDKLQGDREKHIRTLPVLIGETVARNVAIAMFLLQYALVAYLVATRFFTPVMLVVVLAYPTLKPALAVYRRPRPASSPPGYPRGAWPLWFVAFAFQHNRRFGALFVAGLVGDLALQRFIG